MTESSNDPTPFDQIGRSEGVRSLVDRFYDIMDQADEAQTIRALHAKDLRVSRDKLDLFLTGWLGGPPVYVEKYGHPRLRARHLPFSIGIRERNEWMFCMIQALDECVEDDQLRAYLELSFWRIADHMRNREESDE